MFTQEQIKQASLKLNNGMDFPKFIAEIAQLGVTRNDVYVANGISIFFNNEDYSVQTVPDEYPTLIINENSSYDKLAHALEVYQVGGSDYPTFCKQAADAGIEKWVIDLNKRNVRYLDMEGNEVIVEIVPLGG